jgi:UDP-N-acetyl-D-glucosamine dehydrogenase
MKKICIQGLGFVGAAMSVAVSIAKDHHQKPLFDVIGVDLPNKTGMQKIDAINTGKFPFQTSDKYLLASINKAHQQGNLSATIDPSVYSEADVIVVDVNLDISYLDEQPLLELNDFKKSIQVIGKHVKEGTLILIETTVPPGTCEKVVIPTLHSELRKRKIATNSVYVAHSFERVMPGDSYLKSITDFWRVFAGYTIQAGDVCEKFLSSVVNVKEYPLTRLSSTLASETAKVMENTYRATNIAFIDEWTKYAESVDIDLFEVIDAIKERPTHSNIRFPGLGVGGYCLTKDPTFTPAASEQLFGKDLDFPFSRMAVQVNHDMPLHTVARLKSLMKCQLKGKKILVCGVSYRQDVGDTRFSPSETLVTELIAQGALVTCHDPYIRYWNELKISIPDHLPTSTGFNSVIVAVPHQQYLDFDWSSWGSRDSLILDASRVLKKEQRELARSKGIRVESIGRGDGL